MQVRDLFLTVALTVWTLSTTTFGQKVPKADLMVYPPHELNDTLLYLQGVKLIVTNQATKIRTVINLDGVPTVTISGETPNITISIAYAAGKVDTASVENFVLHMKIGRGGGYWRLTEASMEGKISLAGVPLSEDTPEKLVSRMELSAPNKMSFHCGNFGPLSVKIKDLKSRPNATVSLELVDFQLHPFIKGDLKFGSSYDCVGFFSIGILSGWFVAIILLGLLSWGIKMLSNVHTMDRFDDPKGKTITVTATD